MARAATSDPSNTLRILLVEGSVADSKALVRELPYHECTIAGAELPPAEVLDDWLATNKRCPCHPRAHAEKELALKIEELSRSNRELEQFAYVASHDLQEPLRMMTAYTQLLGERYRGRLDETADLYIGYAAEGAQRMQTLIEDLLAYSRVGRAGEVARQVDCSVLMKDVLLNLQGAILESGARITCQQLPQVRADRSQLSQIFQNLIGNAIKFHTQEPPLISVAAERAGEHWVFNVTDNGIGIAPEHAEVIFAPFRRLHTRTEYPGNGIGLAVCAKIVAQQGGRIWVESEPGRGSTFKFTIPAHVPVEKEGVAP
jgi:light-regulated signal transduction histidine kinase (bacteriophytochrome)